jgi:signal transduction histidine kinase
LSKVFDKGETDPANVGGGGLGLAIVKTFTEAHGGKVTVETKEGEGSTFRLSLPINCRNLDLISQSVSDHISLDRLKSAKSSH